LFLSSTFKFPAIQIGVAVKV